METDIVETLRDLTPHSCWGCDEWSMDPCEDAEEVAALLRAAADEIERLRAVCGSMDDPSRCSKFELSEDGTMIRTVTYTHWRSVDT